MIREFRFLSSLFQGCEGTFFPGYRENPFRSHESTYKYVFRSETRGLACLFELAPCDVWPADERKINFFFFTAKHELRLNFSESNNSTNLAASAGVGRIIYSKGLTSLSIRALRIGTQQESVGVDRFSEIFMNRVRPPFHSIITFIEYRYLRSATSYILLLNYEYFLNLLFV